MCRANDYTHPETTTIVEDIKKALTMLRVIACNIVVCTVPDGFWKQSKGRRLQFSYEELQGPRGLLNKEIRSMADGQVSVLDLDAIIAGHHGWASEDVPGYYHKDSLHPNSRGTIMIESCLKQLLTGQEVVVPQVGSVSKEEEDRRALLRQANYSRTSC